MTFRVGQKVVCVISPDAIVGTSGEKPAVEGRVYTIRDIDSRVVRFGGPVCLRFEGDVGKVVHLRPSWGGGTWEIGHDARNFRPVTEHQTDISIFTEMLTPKTRVLEGLGT